MKAIKSNMKDQTLTKDRKILYCPGCDDECSGNSGDYWSLPDNHIFICSNCNIEMELVEKTVRITYK